MNEAEAIKQLIDQNSKLFYMKLKKTPNKWKQQKDEVKRFTFGTS